MKDQLLFSKLPEPETERIACPLGSGEEDEYVPTGVDPHCDELVEKALKTSRAWMLKEVAMEMWECRDGESAEAIFRAWYSWATRSRLAPIRRVARLLKRHLRGVLNAIVARVTNARIEGLNIMIQWFKRSAGSAGTATASATPFTSTSADSTSTPLDLPTRIPEEPRVVG